MDIASCFPLCLKKGGSITIRFVGNMFGNRVKHVLDAFGNLVTLIFFALMTWQLWLYTDQLVHDGETTWVLNWPVSPWWRVTTILILICVPVALVTVIHHMRSALKLKGPTDPPVSSSTEPQEGNS